MKQILLASHNESPYLITVLSEADVADLVRGHQPQVLSSTDGEIDFWFTHNPRVAVNCGATEILLATTRFTAHDVPLLRGDIVIATHDADGKLASLNNTQMTQLLRTKPTRAQSYILDRRFRRDRSLQRRQAHRAVRNLDPFRSC